MIVPVLVWGAVFIGCLMVLFTTVFSAGLLFDWTFARGTKSHEPFWFSLGMTGSIGILVVGFVGVVAVIALGAAVA